MSLEARVAKLEENRVHWDQVLTGIEGTVALILKEQMELKKGQMELKKEQMELKRELLEQKKENNKRYNKIEEILVQIVNNLASK
ncbi:MAG: hypothetical protein ACR2PT_24485 [Endozoicomonas sp.]